MSAFRLPTPVREKIERYGLTRTIDPRHFYPTVGAAVAAFRAETGAERPKMKRKPYERQARVLHGELVAIQE